MNKDEYTDELNEFGDTQLDKDTFNVGEIGIEDIKLNPDFYIHTALLKAQDALIKDNIKDGFAQYRILIEHIEVLATASKIIEDAYKLDVENYKTSDEYKNITDEFSKSTALANKKLFFIMRSVFRHKTATDSLVLDTRKRLANKKPMLPPITDIDDLNKLPIEKADGKELLDILPERIESPTPPASNM